LFEGLRAADDPTTFVRLNWIDVFLFKATYEHFSVTRKQDESQGKIKMAVRSVEEVEKGRTNIIIFLF
jgi:hypothetical protein